MARLPEGTKHSEQTRVIISMLIQFNDAATDDGPFSEVAICRHHQSLFAFGKCGNLSVGLSTDIRTVPDMNR
jgi:hypothetical protein